MSQFLIPPKGGLPKHKNKKSCKSFDLQDSVAERQALEPMLSRNIIKLQITDNHILSKAQSKSKSF